MKLCLGTVQLGLDYGIVGNPKISIEKAIELLEFAAKLGINCFDTSEAYGNAEKIIGQYISRRYSGNENISIISKCNDCIDFKNQYKEHLSNIKITSLNGLLFHTTQDMYNDDKIKSLIEMKKQKVTENIGVSVYNPEDAIYAANQQWVDYLQFPYNVFDQRLDYSNFFNTVRERKITTFARSAFLQGLLTMTTQEVRYKLPFAENYIIKYNEICKKFGYSVKEAAIEFVKANKNINYLVFGVDNIVQLSEFVKIFNTIEINEKMNQKIKEEFFNVEERIITPYMW